MVAVIEPPQKRHPNLLLHCGAQAASRAQVSAVVTPEATESWHPISHLQLIQQVEKTLATNHLKIGTSAHSLTHNGERYFGLMEIMGRNAETCWVLGLRNSHDKKFPAGVVAGTAVFVCDNLSFGGEVKLARKHTRHIVRDLPLLVEQGIGRLLEKWHDQTVRIAHYKDKRLRDVAAHDLVIRATDVGVCSNRQIPAILEEWRTPRYDAFKGRNVWSLFNAFTETLKGGGISELPKRTEALHGLLDSHVGLAGLN
ncbi:hypothetical protein BH09VER1_BH09VER1_23950 [soil metagenome]